MNKRDFSKFKVGTIFNEIDVHQQVSLKHKELILSYPSRLEAMALDPSKIVDNNNLVYKAGQIDFCVSLLKHFHIKVNNANTLILISDTSPRKSLIMHAALLIRAALGFKHGLIIDVKDEANLRHCGLGSSSSLIAGTAAAINELYGCPIAPQDLVEYCAQNHGEEIDGNNDELMPVQCIGGSAVCGHFQGGIIILSGEATPIMTCDLPTGLSVVIGVPLDFDHPDAEMLMKKEDENMDGFQESGQSYGSEVAYRLIHEVMPGLAKGDLRPCKELIFDYRWNMGSIKNCSFVLPRINEIGESLRDLKDDDDVWVVSLSSVGPGFFAVTSKPSKIERRFKELNMKTLVTSIHNEKYRVKNRRSL